MARKKKKRSSRKKQSTSVPKNVVGHSPKKILSTEKLPSKFFSDDKEPTQEVPDKQSSSSKRPPWRQSHPSGRERILIQISEFVYIRTILIVALIGLLFYLIYHLRGVFTPVLIALVLAYLINPLVDRMQSWGLGRNVSIWSLVFLLFMGAFFGSAIIIPAIIDSVSRLGVLIEKIPPLLLEAKVWFEVNFNLHFPKTWVEAVQEWGKAISAYVPNIIKPAKLFIELLFSGGMGILVRFFTLLLIPLFTFYFLKGYESIRYKFVDYIPFAYRDKMMMRLGEIDRMISGFVRGQLIVSLIVGSLYLILLSALEVPMAPAIAAGGAALNVVPYLGFLLTYLFALVAAIVEFQLHWPFFVVLVGMGFIHMFDIFFVTPSVVGEQVGLSEIVVIFAVLAGGQLFGVVGVLLAIPSAAILKVAFSEFLEFYRSTPFFTGENKP